MFEVRNTWPEEEVGDVSTGSEGCNIEALSRVARRRSAKASSSSCSSSLASSQSSC
jgi:hypothetical protein